MAKNFATQDGSICPYCSSEVEQTTGERIYPHQPDLAELTMFVCWPCGAWVGADRDGEPRGFVAREDIRERRGIALTAWTDLCTALSLSFEEAEGYRDKMKVEEKFDMSELGFLDKEQLDRLIRWLDRHLIGNTPEVDALFTD